MENAQQKIAEQQFVVLQLAKEEYGIPILQVQEIIRVPEITRIPNMPDFIEGVINLRGKIIPVIDLHKRFNLETIDSDDKARIIVTQIEKQDIGFIVDSVSEVINLSFDKISEVPQTVSQIDAEYLSGIAKLENRLIILLNLEKVLSNLEKLAIEKSDFKK